MTMSVTEVQVEDVSVTGVSWGAILAGAIASCAVALLLLAFGIGVGFTVISPWSGQGISSTTFSIAAGVYLLVVAMMASAIGGYITGRLRRRWLGHADEAYFRDSAHGFVTWALAFLLSATVLGSATTQILSGAASGATVAAAGAAGAAANNPTDIYVDQLLRPRPAANAAAITPAPSGEATATPGAPAANPNNANQNLAATRAEFGRVMAGAMRRNGDISAPDRAYLAQAIAQRTGMSQAEAEKRVNDTITQAKQAADDARKAAAKFSLWLAASMLLGALAAALAATEGGMLRDSKWYEPGWRWGTRGY